MPLISVIVPVYQVEPYLHRCVDSILAQTLSDFELILVDDGSPDSCGAICDEYAEKDSRIHVMHQNNQGQAAARNHALDWVFANSESEYISFVDSDDWVHPQFLELLLRGIQRFDVNLCQCKHIKTQKYILPKDVEAVYSCITPKEEYIHAYSPFIWEKLYKRHIWKELRFPEGQIYEDLAIWYKLLFQEKQIAFLDEELYYYFDNSDSTVNQKWRSGRLARLNAWDAQVDFFDQYGDEQLLDTALDHYCQIAKHEYYAIERSDRISEDEKNRYQADVERRVKGLVARFRKELKKNGEYPWLMELLHPLAAGIRSKIRRTIRGN